MSKPGIAFTRLRATHTCCGADLDRGPRWVASGAFDRCVRLWDVDRATASRPGGSSALCPLGGLQSVAGATTVGSRERSCPSLDVASREAAAGIRGAHGWRLPRRFRREPHSSPVRWPGPDDQALGHRRGALPESNRCPGTHVQCLAWHADQPRFLSCAGDVRLWDSETGECLRIFQGHGNTIRSVAWSHDYRLFFQPPMTAPCGSGIQKPDAAFKCFTDTKVHGQCCLDARSQICPFLRLQRRTPSVGNERIVLNRDEI